MTLGLRYSVEAGDDLVTIWAYIAGENPKAADKLLSEIEVQCQRLLVFPMMGASREDVRQGLRMLVTGTYLILYRVFPDRVEIVRVVHGRRELDDLFT